MTEADWTAVAAVGSAVAALCALGSALLLWQANRRQLIAADYNSCVETLRQIAEAERRVRDSKDETQRFEFRALLNLMEALASLINAKEMPPTTLKNVEPYLIEAWAYLLGDPDLNDLRHEAITGEDTFGELMKFAEARKDRIEAHRVRYHGHPRRDHPHTPRHSTHPGGH